MARKYAYKVVNRTYSGWHSAWLGSHPETIDLAIPYSIGKKTRSIRGSQGIFCFKNFGKAAEWRDFLESNNPLDYFDILLVRGHGKPRKWKHILDSVPQRLSSHLHTLIAYPANKRREWLDRVLGKGFQSTTISNVATLSDSIAYSSITPIEKVA